MPSTLRSLRRSSQITENVKPEAGCLLIEGLPQPASNERRQLAGASWLPTEPLSVACWFIPHVT